VTATSLVARFAVPVDGALGRHGVANAREAVCVNSRPFFELYGGPHNSNYAERVTMGSALPPDFSPALLSTA